MSLESLEVMLKTHEKNEYAWGDKYEQMEYGLKDKGFEIEEKQKELDQVLKERDDFKVKLEKWSNASVLQNERIRPTIEVPPTTGTIFHLGHIVSFTGIDELALGIKLSQEKTLTLVKNLIDRAYPEEDFKVTYAIIEVDAREEKETLRHHAVDFEKVLAILLIERLVLLRAPRKNDVYSLDLKNIIPSGESLGFTFKRPFKLDHSCCGVERVDCTGSSCKKIEERTVENTSELIHMDLFGPVSVESINRKKYLLGGSLLHCCTISSWVCDLEQSSRINFLNELVLWPRKEIKRAYSMAGRHSKMENQKGKGPDWMFDLDLLTPSMNYIPVRKENYADSKEQGKTCDDAEELNDQHFSVLPLTSKNLLPNVIMNDQGIDFLRGKEEYIYLAKGKDMLAVFHSKVLIILSPQSTGITPTDWLMMLHTGGVFLQTLLMMWKADQIIGKSTAGVQTRRKLQDSTSNQHQALHRKPKSKKVSSSLSDESWVVKQCKKNCFNSSSRGLGVLCDYSKAKGVIELIGFLEQGEMNGENLSGIGIFLGLSSVYQMDVRVFLIWQTLTEEVYDITASKVLKILSSQKGKDVEVTMLRFQVTPKVIHLHAVKWDLLAYHSFHQHNLGLWYPKTLLSIWKLFRIVDYAWDNHV
ncbi:hypothetical protein Tco_1427680 [Tanacetum coccineum]